jgi:hypothetical protein
MSMNPWLSCTDGNGLKCQGAVVLFTMNSVIAQWLRPLRGSWWLREDGAPRRRACGSPTHFWGTGCCSLIDCLPRLLLRVRGKSLVSSVDSSLAATIFDNWSGRAWAGHLP